MDPSMDLGGLLFPYMCLTCPRWGLFRVRQGDLRIFGSIFLGLLGGDEVKNKICMVNA